MSKSTAPPIPEELIESELFGHTKGSFTGAGEDKVGKFRMADNGTLFLDEVGDMSLRTQAKVLRVLEEQRLEPIGSHSAVRTSTCAASSPRRIASSRISFHTANSGEDLFYRLNVIPFTVPALRERVEDIPSLARHFLVEFSAAYGRHVKELSAMHPWPS